MTGWEIDTEDKTCASEIKSDTLKRFYNLRRWKPGVSCVDKDWVDAHGSRGKQSGKT